MELSPTVTRADDHRADGPPVEPAAGRRRPHLSLAMIGAIATGCVAAVLLPFAPFVPPTESGVTGAALLGLGLGWALMAGVMFGATARWQAWALAGTAVFLAGGVLLLVLGAPAHRALDWVWPAALAAVAAAMLLAVRRKRPLLPRKVLHPVAALLVLASVGGGIETIAEAADAQAHPAPGRLISVGDHRLHLRCEGTGSPTVVFEAGGGEMSSNLGLLTPAVGRATRICTYDRAGRGWSEAAASPPSGSRIAEDLHTLLHRGGVSGPYVLAGHSFGGLYVRSFAARYPAEVAGMILVDSTASGGSSDDSSAEVLHRLSALLSVPARFGLARLVASATGDDLPAPFADEVRMSASTSGNLQSVLDEYVDAGAAAGEAAKLTDLGSKPLVVLTARLGNPATWFADQDRMTGLSADSVHRTLMDVDHQGLVGDEKGAAATTAAIIDVVTAVRDDQPLPQR